VVDCVNRSEVVGDAWSPSREVLDGEEAQD